MMVESIRQEVEEAKEIRRQKALEEEERLKELEKLKEFEKKKNESVENTFKPGFVEGLPTAFPGTGVIQRGINFVRQLSVSSDHPQRLGFNE